MVPVAADPKRYTSLAPDSFRDCAASSIFLFRSSVMGILFVFSQATLATFKKPLMGIFLRRQNLAIFSLDIGMFPLIKIIISH
jgi:hypothetical protein